MVRLTAIGKGSAPHPYAHSPRQHFNATTPWLILAVTATSVIPAHAEHRMEAIAGIGLTSAMNANGHEDIEGDGKGGYAEASYYYKWWDWLTPMTYGGVHITAPESNCSPPPAMPPSLTAAPVCNVSSQFAHLGGQVRLLAPIPYVAPYVEVGLGGSLGRFSTRAGEQIQVLRTGLAYHVPVTLGLRFGEEHHFHLRARYLIHPRERQISGGIGFGIGFALSTDEVTPSEQPKEVHYRLVRPASPSPTQPTEAVPPEESDPQ